MTTTQFLGTAEIPPRYWKAACLIGPTPITAATADQRASYCMYIPAAHYAVDPTSPSGRLPLIVNVHGSSRRVEQCRDTLIPLADRLGAAVLAPLFPCAVAHPNDKENYKFLRFRDIRYDLLLLSMIDDEVARRWPGVRTDQFFLMGFSGGGQFAARFFYLHPHRLAGVSIGAPGTVTRLDGALKWPWGIGGVEREFDGLRVDVGALKVVANVQLVVGDQDTHEPTDGLVEWLAANTKDERYKDVKGPLPDRRTAIEGLRRELLAAGVNVRFDVVPGAAHEALKVLPTVMEFLESVLVGGRQS